MSSGGVIGGGRPSQTVVPSGRAVVVIQAGRPVDFIAAGRPVSFIVASEAK